MAFTQPLDLYNLLVVTLAGNSTIFLFGTAIILAILATKYRMPNLVFGLLLLVYVGIFGVMYGDYVILGVMVIGIIIAVGLGRIITRQ